MALPDVIPLGISALVARTQEASDRPRTYCGLWIGWVVVALPGAVPLSENDSEQRCRESERDEQDYDEFGQRHAANVPIELLA